MSSLAGLGHYHRFAALQHCYCAALRCNAGQSTKAPRSLTPRPLGRIPETGLFTYL